MRKLCNDLLKQYYNDLKTTKEIRTIHELIADAHRVLGKEKINENN